MNNKPREYRAWRICAVPVEKINAVLGSELEPGDAWLSAKAHRHIAEDHSDDYEICIAHLRIAILEPTYVGQAPHHAENIEIIKRVRLTETKFVLVALALTPNAYGNYNVRSSYLIDQTDLDSRRNSRRVKPIW